MRRDVARGGTWGLHWLVWLCLAASLPLQGTVSVVRAAEDGKQGAGGLFADKDTPLVITADTMELQRRQNIIVYRGNVLVEREDVRIASDVLSARYDPEEGVVKNVVAEGKVRVSHSGREMTGDKAVFDGLKETITVSGNTIVREGKNSISGGRITIYINEDRSVVENTGGRVKAVIFPEQLKRPTE